MTAQPPVGPLDSETVKLLVKGDVLRCHASAYGLIVGEGDVVQLSQVHGSKLALLGLDGRHTADRFTFIGRPDADGWIPWGGGEKPPFEVRVDLRFRDGEILTSEYAPSYDWLHSPRRDATDDIIAYRLSSKAVEPPMPDTRSDLIQAVQNAEFKFRHGAAVGGLTGSDFTHYAQLQIAIKAAVVAVGGTWK